MLSWHRCHPVSLGQARSLTIYLCVCLCRWPTLWRPSAVWCLQPWWWFMPKGAASKVSPHFGYFLHLLWVSGVRVWSGTRQFLNKISYIFCRLGLIPNKFVLFWLCILTFFLLVTFFASLLQSVCWSGTEKSHCEQRVSITWLWGGVCVCVCEYCLTHGLAARRHRG